MNSFLNSGPSWIGRLHFGRKNRCCPRSPPARYGYQKALQANPDAMTSGFNLSPTPQKGATFLNAHRSEIDSIVRQSGGGVPPDRFEGEPNEAQLMNEVNRMVQWCREHAARIEHDIHLIRVANTEEPHESSSSPLQLETTSAFVMADVVAQLRADVAAMRVAGDRAASLAKLKANEALIKRIAESGRMTDDKSLSRLLHSCFQPKRPREYARGPSVRA